MAVTKTSRLDEIALKPVVKAVRERSVNEKSVDSVEVSRLLHVDVVKVAGIVSFYFMTSLSIVFLNKYIMSYSSVKFPRPVFITWYQLAVALASIVSLGRIGIFVPRIKYDRNAMSRVAPLAGLFVLMLVANNVCLKYVEVSFYQVVRNLNVVFNVILMRLLEKHFPSKRVMIACAIVIVGYVMAALGEIKFSWLGLIFGFVSSLILSVYGFCVKRTLVAFKGDDRVMQVYNTLLALLLLTPYTWAIGDFKEILNSPLIYSSWFWLVMTITAMMGYLINIATFLQIKHTSPLTHTITGTAKGMVQTMLGVLIFRNPVSLVNAAGILTCLSGSFLYAWIRYQEVSLNRSTKNINNSANIKTS